MGPAGAPCAGSSACTWSMLRRLDDPMSQMKPPKKATRKIDPNTFWASVGLLIATSAEPQG